MNVIEAKSTALGSFLRWHRHRLTPRDVGLPEYGRRRVPGLRREEVANLAGISTEYYIRLEQGRERTPSPNVVDALADALRLDADQTAHLRNIARPGSRRNAGGRRTDVPEGATRLLDHLNVPAVILNRYMDVVTSNHSAQALFPNMTPGTNRLRAVFLDPREREFWRDWESAVADAVAQLRADIGNELESSSAHALIGDLRNRCRHFDRLWSCQHVQQRACSPVRVRHHLLGELELHREKLLVTGAEGLFLFIYFTEPGSASAEKLDRLRHLQAGSGSTRMNMAWLAPHR
ncbi:helix-turn-helix transcriptional regulator [Mycobacterium sp. ITM-2016-00317]|uniref:helix-turn-helix domain-containing protein n=1 Tax=Mycobacterium sp. ITM-2016-00317 TaxID=2099694 RepID=UPI00287FA96F|nr:helix-turn-helix transcriptional regulator [Mycobacterium sp. ITM-2016-00317]WNG88695.1 helix-turn-helix transcriptional regulator [Mycobacterium sp. ITM-2016-00317]